MTVFPAAALPAGIVSSKAMATPLPSSIACRIASCSIAVATEPDDQVGLGQERSIPAAA